MKLTDSEVRRVIDIALEQNGSSTRFVHLPLEHQIAMALGVDAMVKALETLGYEIRKREVSN